MSVLTATVAAERHRPRPLAGYRSTLRFMVRRDRLRAPIWIAAILGLVIVSAASVIGLYDSPAGLQEYGDLATADLALKAIAGPGYGLQNATIGAVVMNEVMLYSFLGIALMSIFLVVRHTRAEEETDRAELVRSFKVGRHATLAAAVTWVSVINLIVAVGLTVGLTAQGIPAAGTLAYSGAALGLGLSFVGIAAAAAQIASSARAATAGAGAVLGASFLLRAVGDLGTTGITWFSPLGWAQSIRAFADERWWVLAPLVATFAATSAVAVTLEARRDLGAGLLKQRPGPAVGNPRLATPLAMAARLSRTSVVWWLLGLSTTGLFFGLVADQAEKIMENESIAQVFAQAGGSPTDAFLATMVLMVALVGSGFTISTVLRLRAEELANRVEPVLAASVMRRNWLWSYFIVSIAGSALLMAGAGTAIGLGYAVQVGDASKILPLIGACLSVVPAMGVLGAFALLLIGARTRWSPAAWVGLVVAALVGLLAETLKLPNWFRDLSPFHHLAHMPAESFAWAPTAIVGSLAIVLVGAATFAMNQRDIG